MASLLEQWRDTAYSAERNPREGQRFWAAYFEVEKGFYQSLLAEEEPVRGTVPEFCEKYGIKEIVMTGILDPEKLYKNMVLAKADWLYGLPEWDRYFDREKQEELYREAKRSGTVVKGKKIFPNDPCPCGSGLKYKKCHGRRA